MNNFQLDECVLCPRMCRVNRLQDERGVCGANATMRLARAALHYWEEPPLSGESGSGALFFASCPLRCVYCQNATIANGEVGYEVTSDKLAQICLNLQNQNALNINCVTPTHYTPLIRESILLAQDRGLHLPIVWNTSGYERAEIIDELSDTVDIYLADFKYGDNELAKSYSMASDYPEVALKALSRMVSNVGRATYDSYLNQDRMTKGVIVRHLVLPGSEENSKRALRMLHSAFGNDIQISIMNQYTPILATRKAQGDAVAASVLNKYPELACRATDETYERILDFADEIGIEDYFWQEGPAAEESFVPVWDGEGVV